jgi:hypothetical protein
MAPSSTCACDVTSSSSPRFARSFKPASPPKWFGAWENADACDAGHAQDGASLLEQRSYVWLPGRYRMSCLHAQ